MAPSVQPVGDMQVPSHDVLFYNVSFGEGFLSSFFFWVPGDEKTLTRKDSRRRPRRQAQRSTRSGKAALQGCSTHQNCRFCVRSIRLSWDRCK